MRLEARLAKLEALKARAMSSEGGRAQAQLWDELVRVAWRLQGTHPDEAWCKSSSPKEIAAKVLLAKVGGETTPALDERARELSEQDGHVANLFKALENIKCAT